MSPSHESGLGGKSAKPCVLLLSLNSDGAECAGPGQKNIFYFQNHFLQFVIKIHLFCFYSNYIITRTFINK